MNKKTKKRMLVLSWIFLALWATTLAANSSDAVLNVQAVLNSAIQDIQKIYFSSWAVKNTTDPEIPVQLDNGTVSIWGRVMFTTSWAENILATGSTWSSLFQWKANYLSGVDSYIIAGSWNKIYENVTWSAVVWGRNNTIVEGKDLYIIGGSGNKILSGKNSFIVGGKWNELSWNNSYILMGSWININANDSVAIGHNIVVDKDRVFVWGDSRTEEIHPENKGTFIINALNGINIIWSTTKPKFTATGAVNVDGIIQVADESVKCWPSIQWAVQFTWGQYGCFCWCNWQMRKWVSLVPTAKCRELCPKLNDNPERSYEGAKCRYEGSAISITEGEACEDGTVSWFVVTPDSTNTYPVKWTRSCIGDDWTTTWCSVNASVIEWSCGNGCVEWQTCAWTRDVCSSWTPVPWTVTNGVYRRECHGVNTWQYQKCSICDDPTKYMDTTTPPIQCVDRVNGACLNETNTYACNPWKITGTWHNTTTHTLTWSCESTSWWGKAEWCYSCDWTENWVWSSTAKHCVEKKNGVCWDSIAINNESTLCKTNWWVTWQTKSNPTFSWYCKWENGWTQSQLCHYCANGTEWDENTGICSAKITGACWDTTSSTFSTGNENTLCQTNWWVTKVNRTSPTYTWYCKWENGWAQSQLCHYCTESTTRSWSIQKCVSTPTINYCWWWTSPGCKNITGPYQVTNVTREWGWLSWYVKYTWDCVSGTIIYSTGCTTTQTLTLSYCWNTSTPSCIDGASVTWVSYVGGHAWIPESYTWSCIDNYWAILTSWCTSSSSTTITCWTSKTYPCPNSALLEGSLTGNDTNWYAWKCWTSSNYKSCWWTRKCPVDETTCHPNPTNWSLCNTLENWTTTWMCNYFTKYACENQATKMWGKSCCEWSSIEPFCYNAIWWTQNPTNCTTPKPSC